jgi:hypothetical protein
MLADDSDIWLIPAGEEPFTLVSWYYRFTGGLLFDNRFRLAFGSNFYKESSTQYFDLYVRKTGDGSGQ